MPFKENLIKVVSDRSVGSTRLKLVPLPIDSVIDCAISLRGTGVKEKSHMTKYNPMFCILVNEMNGAFGYDSAKAVLGRVQPNEMNLVICLNHAPGAG